MSEAEELKKSQDAMMTIGQAYQLQVQELQSENEALREQVRVAEEAIRDCINKMNCPMNGCFHKTKDVRSGYCTSHELMYRFLSLKNSIKLRQGSGDKG